MTKDIMNIAVVSYQPAWGDKEKNLERIIGFAECAAKRGAQMVVLPELALIGYDAEPEKGSQCMHHRLAEPIPGPSTAAIGEVAKRCDIYIAYGLSECDENGTVYNSAAVLGPDGALVGSYRKMHLPGLEGTWAARGDEPCIFDTPWGKVGLAICYDTFAFTEIMRYERAAGCRLHLNLASVGTFVTNDNIRTSVEFQAANNSMYIATANNTGFYKTDDLVGGANVVGPAKNCPEVHYYAGVPFGAEGSDEQELYIGTIDLSYTAKLSCTSGQWEGESPDFDPALYIKMYQRLLD